LELGNLKAPNNSDFLAPLDDEKDESIGKCGE
jgi:hypothetical protein